MGCPPAHGSERAQACASRPAEPRSRACLVSCPGGGPELRTPQPSGAELPQTVRRRPSLSPAPWRVECSLPRHTAMPSPLLGLPFSGRPVETGGAGPSLEEEAVSTGCLLPRSGRQPDSLPSGGPSRHPGAAVLCQGWRRRPRLTMSSKNSEARLQWQFGWPFASHLLPLLPSQPCVRREGAPGSRRPPPRHHSVARQSEGRVCPAEGALRPRIEA